MSPLRRSLIVVGALLVLPSSGTALAAAQEQLQDLPGAVTALDQATVEAMSTARRAPQEWLPVGASANSQPPVGTRLLGAGVATFALDDNGLLDPGRMEVLRGPQGILLGSDRTTLANTPTSEFYGTNSTATVAVVEVEGWPPEDLSQLFELGLGFAWSGDEVLEESPFPGDPLLGLGNVSSFGWINGTPFVNYAKIQEDVWTHFSDPLLRFETTTSDDRHFVGWVLPGIPSALSVTISYSPDATIESMIAQQVDVPIPTDIASYPLTAEFDLVDPGLQSSLSALFAPTDTEQPDDTQPPPETTEAADDEPAPAVTTITTPADDIDTAGDGETVLVAETDDDDDSGGVSALFVFLISLVGAAFLAWLVRWYLSTRKQVGEVPAPPTSPPGGSEPMDTERSWAIEVADRHLRAGQPTAEDGWFAPTLAETSLPGESPEGEPGEWSGVFANSQTFERVGMDDPRYRELLERFGLTPPAEYVDVIGMDTAVVLDSDPGDGPVRPEASSQESGPLESMLPVPGPGQTLEDVIVPRVIKAHEVTGGAQPVDGWIAPSNEARTVGMLLDDAGRAGYNPQRWSGHFLNVETGTWLRPGQPGYDDVKCKLASELPIEATDPIGFDDTPGTN